MTKETMTTDALIHHYYQQTLDDLQGDVIEIKDHHNEEPVVVFTKTKDHQWSYQDGEFENRFDSLTLAVEDFSYRSLMTFLIRRFSTGELVHQVTLVKNLIKKCSNQEISLDEMRQDEVFKKVVDTTKELVQDFHQNVIILPTDDINALIEQDHQLSVCLNYLFNNASATAELIQVVGDKDHFAHSSNHLNKAYFHCLSWLSVLAYLFSFCSIKIEQAQEWATASNDDNVENPALKEFHALMQSINQDTQEGHHWQCGIYTGPTCTTVTGIKNIEIIEIDGVKTLCIKQDFALTRITDVDRMKKLNGGIWEISKPDNGQTYLYFQQCSEETSRTLTELENQFSSNIRKLQENIERVGEVIRQVQTQQAQQELSDQDIQKH